MNGLARNQVDVYDAATMQLLKRFPIASMPSHLDYAPDSSRVFVSLQGTDSLVAIDLNGWRCCGRRRSARRRPACCGTTASVLVADMGTDYVAVVDPADGHVIERIHTGKGAHNLFLSPDRKIIWVNNRVGGTTTSLDATTLTPIRSYAFPAARTTSTSRPTASCGSRGASPRRWRCSIRRRGEYQTIDVGRSPHGMFLNPKGSAQPSVAAR